MAGAPWLLRRMAAEFDERGALRPATTGWMYATYAAHATGYAWALRQSHRLRPATFVLGTASAAAGAGLLVAGMGRFAGPAQVSGTRTGPFVTGGVYRLSRNPQYTGYVLALGGVAVACRSLPALALAAAAGAVFAWWVPVEERHLARVVGRPYERYLEATPRWFGWRREAPDASPRSRPGRTGV